jgi:hypothetical protein
MLSEAERAKVLVSWNAHPQPLPQRETIKELFEEQVLRTPSAPAISFDGEQLSFDELNRRANRIAWLLREQGVGPGTFVGILMEKSLDLVPAVLGGGQGRRGLHPARPAVPGRPHRVHGRRRPAGAPAAQVNISAGHWTDAGPGWQSMLPARWTAFPRRIPPPSPAGTTSHI